MLLVLGLHLTNIQAVILLSTGDPSVNTSAPKGRLDQSGWNLQGEWGNFLGTPISPQCFLTARHVGGAVGDTFSFAGKTFTAKAWADDPTSDLRIWQIAGTFPTYAELYSNTDEVGKGLVVFGRGTQRGEPVQIIPSLASVLKGWMWGAADGRMRWGENNVEAIVNGDQLDQSPTSSQTVIGDLLKATFDLNGGPNEAAISGGDSGGGVFLQDGTTWRLAGINYAVDGPYSLTNSGPGFNAALFDQGGCYTEDEGIWTIIPDMPDPQPGASYATRISVHLDWIQNIVARASEITPVVESALFPNGPYEIEADVQVDAIHRQIIIPEAGNARFYQLSSLYPLLIKSVKAAGSGLILTYQPMAVE